jgi:hypothetical protein
MDLEDLTGEHLITLKRFNGQSLLPVELLRLHPSVDPDRQLQLAEKILRNADDLHPKLGWRGQPEWHQLLFVCELIWYDLGASVLRDSAVRSAAQLAFKVRNWTYAHRIRQLTNDRIAAHPETSPSEFIDEVLDFQRSWGQHRFPGWLVCLHDIQRHVFGSRNLVPGDYRPYAVRTEHLNVPPIILALEEYGLPSQLSSKLLSSSFEDLDTALDRIRSLDVGALALSDFERELLLYVKAVL